jgi:hypothetical protein
VGPGRALAVAVLGIAALAPCAAASEVVRMDHGRASVVDDPYPPPATGADLPRPPGPEIAGPRAAARGPSVARAVDATLAAGRISRARIENGRRRLVFTLGG